METNRIISVQHQIQGMHPSEKNLQEGLVAILNLMTELNDQVNHLEYLLEEKETTKKGKLWVEIG